MPRLLWFTLVTLFLLGGFIAGCGEPAGPAMVACEGTLLANGQPLEVANRELGLGMVQLEFIPVDSTPDAQTYAATADAAGKFSLPGGLTPGKYKVAVRQWDPYPETDKLQGAFAKERTPIVRDITGQEGKIEIDLATAK
jgi:hypothetical protein